MPDIRVDAVSDRRQQKQFFRLPWDLYRDDPRWVPPLRTNQLELLGYKPHPFHNDAEMQTFIARRGDQVCGRVAAIIHRPHLERSGQQQGFFGFFESVNDENVAGRLFDAAESWLTDREMTSIRGPLNPAFHYEIGMLVDGFDQSPMFMTTYNPPWYPQLLERLGGFEKAQDLYAFHGHINMVPQLLETIGFGVEQARQRFSVHLRSMDTRRFGEEIQMFLEIYNQSFQSHWGFVPMSPAEVSQISSELRHLIIPEITVIAEIDDKPVGCIFVLPDYNPRIRQINGRLFPFGFLRLLWNRRGIGGYRLISANVVPEFQMWGVAMMMLDYLVPIAQRIGVQDVEFSWVAESNKLSRLSLENGGARRTKTWRIFDRSIV